MPKTVASPLARKFQTKHVADFLGRFRVDDEYERCAVILGGPTILLREVPNASPYTEWFAIRKSDVETALRATQRPLVGYLHTHLPHHEATPSEKDLKGCAKHPDLVYAIYHPGKHKLVIYQSEKTYYRLEFIPIDKSTRRKR